MNRHPQKATDGNLRAAEVGGAGGIDFELRGFLTEDVADIVETFVKLEYSLDWIIAILNAPPEEKRDVIL
jgi:hypothetical protein